MRFHFIACLQTIIQFFLLLLLCRGKRMNGNSTIQYFLLRSQFINDGIEEEKKTENDWVVENLIKKTHEYEYLDWFSLLPPILTSFSCILGSLYFAENALISIVFFPFLHLSLCHQIFTWWTKWLRTTIARFSFFYFIFFFCYLCDGINPKHVHSNFNFHRTQFFTNEKKKKKREQI